MVERICSHCQVGNPLDNRFCGRCGASLETPRQLSGQQTALAPAVPALPAHVKQVSKAVAVSLATLAAEAGMAWLRGRVERLQTGAPSASQPPAATQIVRPAAMQNDPPPANDISTVLRQRVVQVWEDGTLTRQIVERTVWRRGS